MPHLAYQNKHSPANTELSKEIENDRRVDKELVAKWNILNTKQLHALIINILYEHYYDSNRGDSGSSSTSGVSSDAGEQASMVTEKILYFVVYVLELAVFMSLNFSLKDSKLSPSASGETNSSSSGTRVPFNELNFETWFKSHDIVENLCTYVPFTKYELSKEVAPCSESDSSGTQASTASTAADIFVSKQPLPPLKKMCSGNKKRLLCT